MFSKYTRQLNEIYKDDFKKLRTGTILYGHLYEGRYQTCINRPLTLEEIEGFEQAKGHFPNNYKEMLQHFNGLYLFDLIHIAGKTRESMRGLSIEEQVHEPADLEHLMPDLKANQRLPENSFAFASSMITDTFYVMKEDGQVLVLDYKKLHVVQEFSSLEQLLDGIFEQGKMMVEKGEYLEFE